MTDSATGVRIIGFDPSCPELPIVGPGSRAVAVVWPGTGATQRSFHHIQLAPGGQTVELRHPGEAVYYVRDGSGSVTDPNATSSDTLVEGSMVSVGGPAPADRHLLRAAGVLND